MAISNLQSTNKPRTPSTPMREGGRDPQHSDSARWLPLIILALLIVGGLIVRNRQSQSAARAQAAAAAAPAAATLVRTAVVGVGTITQTLDVTGSLRSNQEVSLVSKITGRVARVDAAEGQMVRRGQLLIELDDADLAAQVGTAQANLDAAQVRYQQAVVGLPARIEQVETTIDQARTALQTAQARYKQAQLGESPRVVAAQNQVAEAREAVRTAQARLKQARDTAQQTQEQVDADVARAKAAQAQAVAALADVKRGSRDQQIAQAKAQVNLAEAQLRDAATSLNRQKMLLAGGAAPQASVDSAQTKYDVAQAQLDSAKENLSLVQEGATNEQIREAQEQLRQADAGVATALSGRTRIPLAQSDVTAALAALAQSQQNLSTAVANLSQIPIAHQDTEAARVAVVQAQSSLQQAIANRSQIPIAREDVRAAAAAEQESRATLQLAEVNRGYARIFSPIDGVVTQKLVEAGGAASSNITLMNLVGLNSIYFEAQVSENNIAQIKPGDVVSIVVPSKSNQKVQGLVRDVIPVADAKSRLFRLRVDLPRGGAGLTPGAFASGSIVTSTVRQTLVVPTIALQPDGDKSIALVAAGPVGAAKVERRVVGVGVQANGQTQVLGGLSRGDQVILNNNLLEPGTRVKIDNGAP